jgi:PKD repeat protein
VTAAGIYSLVVTASSGLAPVLYTSYITVEDVLTNATFSVTTPANISATIRLTGSITGWPVTYTWAISNGTTSVPFTGTTVDATSAFPVPGVYTVVMTATNHWGPVTASQAITAMQPVSGVTILNSWTPPNAAVYFTAVVPAGWPITGYVWSFSGTTETQTTTNGVYTYTATGTYTVGVTVTNELTSFYVSKNVVVENLLTAVTFSPFNPCKNTTDRFTAIVTGGTAITYQWELSDANGTDVQVTTAPQYYYFFPNSPGSVYTLKVYAFSLAGPIMYQHNVTITTSGCSSGYVASSRKFGGNIFSPKPGGPARVSQESLILLDRRDRLSYRQYDRF